MAKQQFTEEQKQAALERVEKEIAVRREADKSIRRNSFAEWGNDKCISRALDTKRNMKDGVASDAQYRYWLNH